jgi:hypothetical protein
LCLLFFGTPEEGLERAAPVRTLVQKVSGGHFLARGRVHRSESAAYGCEIRTIKNRNANRLAPQRYASIIFLLDIPQ